MSRTKIKKWRETAGLTQEAAAVMVGITFKPARTAWHKWESGQIEPPLEVINKIEAFSEGEITFRDWLAVRREYLAGLNDRQAA